MMQSSWSKTAVYFLTFITIGLAVAVVGPTLPNLAANTGTLLSEIGFLFTARSVGFLLGSVWGARLFDRLPGHRVLAVMIFMMALMLALIPLMATIWLLTAVLLILGFVESMADVGGNTLITWVHRGNVGPYMNGLHFFFGVGAFLSPIVVAQVLLRTESINGAYWLLALLIFPVSLLVGLLPSPAAVHQQTRQQPQQQTNFRLIGLIMTFLFLYVGAELGFGGWVYTYATQTSLANETAAAYLNSAFWGALTVGRLLAIPLAVRLRPRIILLIDLIGALASVGLILIWPKSSLTLWLGTIGLGLSFASIFPTTIALAERRIALTGKTTGLIFVGAGLGSMTLPWLMGYLLDNISPNTILWLILLVVILASGILKLIVQQEKQKSLEV